MTIEAVIVQKKKIFRSLDENEFRCTVKSRVRLRGLQVGGGPGLIFPELARPSLSQ